MTFEHKKRYLAGPRLSSGVRGHGKGGSEEQDVEESSMAFASKGGLRPS